MDWRDARDRTLSEWLRIRESVPVADSVELLTAINAVCALCDKAREAAGSAAERCSRCIAFGDSATCEEYRFRLGELILDKDFDTADRLLEEIIHRVRQAPLPQETSAYVGQPESVS